MKLENGFVGYPNEVHCISRCTENVYIEIGRPETILILYKTGEILSHTFPQLICVKCSIFVSVLHVSIYHVIFKDDIQDTCIHVK